MLFMTVFLLLSVQTNGISLAPQVSAMVTSLRKHCQMMISVSVGSYEYINITYHGTSQNKFVFCSNTRICQINCNWYFSYKFQVQISSKGFPYYHGNWTFKANKNIYKLHKPGKLQISEKNTESLWLSYDITNYYDNILVIQPCLYRIFYKSEWEPSPKNSITKETKIQLKNLMPYTTYTIHIQVKVEKSIYWSDNLTVTERTLPSAPYAGPKSTNGSYLETTCAEKSRCFMLYWAMIPMPLRNGIFDRYVIQQDNRILLETSEIYVQIKDQPQNKDLWFEIRARNNDSQLSPPTVIHIPPKAPDKPKGVSVVRLNNTHVNISWALEQSLENVTVTVMSCLGVKTGSSSQCKSDVMWTEIQNKNFTILKTVGETNFLAAVYVSNSEGSSSLTFAECILSGGISNKPQIPQIGVRYPHQVDLWWPIFSCEDLFGRPTMFQILYAEGKTCRNGLKLNIPAIGTKPETANIKIKDLKPFTKYFICLRIHTEQGWSQESPQIETSTAETNPGSSVVNLKVVSITSSNVTLRWNSTLQPNGFITHHFIYYNKHKTYSNTSNMATVSYLDPNSKYNFTVSTCNKAGCSEKSSYVNATTLSKYENLKIMVTLLFVLGILLVIGCGFLSKWVYKKYEKTVVDVVYPDEIEDEPYSNSQTILIGCKNGEEKPDNTKLVHSKETAEKIQDNTTLDPESQTQFICSKSGDFRNTGEGQSINLAINDRNSRKTLEMVPLNGSDLSTNMHKNRLLLSPSIFRQANLDSDGYITQDRINSSELSQGSNYDSNGYITQDRINSSELSQDSNYDSNGYITQDRINSSELSQGSNYDSNGYITQDRINSSELSQDSNYDSNGYITRDRINSSELSQGSNYDSNGYIT